MEMMRCFSEAMIGLHVVIGARVDHGRTMLAKVYPVVKAHHECVDISGIFVSTCPHVHSTCQLQFPDDSSSFTHVSRGKTEQ